LDNTRKNARTLDMYERLCEGKSINKREESKRFGVDERSIQRDIDDIRAFLKNRNGDKREVIYDRSKEGFIMTGSEEAFLTNEEIFAVSKVLLDSRAFTKKEIGRILDKMVAECVPQNNIKLVSDLISNEKYHYVELKHQSRVKEKLWELGNDVKQCNLLEIIYKKQVSSSKTIKRIIQPVGLIFSEYYFYLNAFIVEKGENEYIQLYDYPALFRLDRIKSIKELGVKFKIPYSDRFEEGEFRKRVQFMFPGRLMKIKLKYFGTSAEAVLDRLPTARIISEKQGEFTLEAEVYGNGIIMWILSQGNKIEIVEPLSLRDEMKKTLQEMMDIYY